MKATRKHIDIVIDKSGDPDFSRRVYLKAQRMLMKAIAYCIAVKGLRRYKMTEDNAKLEDYTTWCNLLRTIDTV